MSTNQSSTSTVVTTSSKSSSSLPTVGNLGVYVPSTAAACMPYLNEVAENYSNIDEQLNKQYLQEATIGSELAHDKAAAIRKQANDEFTAAEYDAFGQILGGATSMVTAYSSFNDLNPKEGSNASSYKEAIQKRRTTGPNASQGEAEFSSAAERETIAKRRQELISGGSDGKVYGRAPASEEDKRIINTCSEDELTTMSNNLNKYQENLNLSLRSRTEIKTTMANGASSIITGVTGAISAGYRKEAAYQEINKTFDDASSQINQEVQSGRNSQFNQVADLEMQIWQAEVQITQANKM